MLVHSNRTVADKEHKIVVIGDSHTRGWAMRLKNNIHSNFEVTGVVKQGSNTDVLVNSVKSYISDLGENGVIVFCGGANDVSKNNAKQALRNIKNFTMNNNHTNIILVSIPHRYDLIEKSFVNNETRVVNKKLMKLVKMYTHTTFLELNLNRECFTRQGFNFNGRGKELVTKQVVSQINK